LALIAPAWLRRHSRAAWAKRYAGRAVDYPVGTGKEKRRALAEQIGADGDQLLSVIYAAETPAWLREVPAVEMLRRVWVQQFCTRDEMLCWRTDHEGIPPSRSVISSPYDVDARFARKGNTQWIGYKAHVTESCEDGSPRLITDVRTSVASAPDGESTPIIHQELEGKDFLPSKHIVDTGYLDAELLVTSRRDYDVDLLGPTRPNYRWQARDRTGFEAGNFHIEWERKRATCPRGAHEHQVEAGDRPR
jgi:transposase